MSKVPQPSSWKLNAVAMSVAITGLLTLGTTLFALAHPRHVRIVVLDAHFTVLAGISLIYLATLLRRGKRNAWLVTVAAYIFLISRNIRHFVFDFHDADHYLLPTVLNLLLPIATLVALIFYQRLFSVRSEPRSFGVAVRRSALILAVAFLYGSVGFQLFDTRDFHQEIPPLTAAHYAVDQFGLTTNNKPTAYTKRSRFFVDSLAAVSLASVFYMGVSFFAPIRFRLQHSRQDFEDMLTLAKKYSTTSEDFFKFWPTDKDYFFDDARQSGLAYHTARGVALVVGDAIGPVKSLPATIKKFEQYCRLNDWQPAFIHIEPKDLGLYKKLGYESQKIGEEAIIDTTHFNFNVAPSKYFRQINNRFTKLGYTCDVLEPPHSQQAMTRLKEISDDWLKAPGRTERGFMMGYFNDAYMQQCRLVIARDSSGSIQAFLNQVPTIVPSEANYDFLRQAQNSPGNIGDYLMLNFIHQLHADGVDRLNIGLSPLAGLDNTEGAVSSLFNFVYTKAGRFYSFQGLTKFKSKYEPSWQPRYVIYRGGLRGLTKSMNALLKAMNR